ncbi:MAG: TatD family hydrolase [Chlamydiae bacterium]|nr:TatD family hydrolase [Chlamydiota bacterium]MBI3265910.1 TatD family hydrolase [Chlamydiota bacterium]
MIDTHVHLNDPAFDEDRALAIERAWSSGLKILMDVTEDLTSFEKSLKLFEKEKNIWSAIGFHPHQARVLNEDDLKSYGKWMTHPKVVAVGEIGLDYYYEHRPRDLQKKAFEPMLNLAVKNNLPVLIHTRDSEDDVLAMLKQFPGIMGLIHCYTGSLESAKAFLDLGFYISFSGIVTFKKAHDLRAVVKEIPLNRILVETDAPYLAPEPLRGKRNEPAFVMRTAEEMAKVRGIDVEVFHNTVMKNAVDLFKRMQ